MKRRVAVVIKIAIKALQIAPLRAQTYLRNKGECKSNKARNTNVIYGQKCKRLDPQIVKRRPET